MADVAVQTVALQEHLNNRGFHWINETPFNR